MKYTKVEMNIFARDATKTELDNIKNHKSIQEPQELFFLPHITDGSSLNPPGPTRFPYCCISITSDKLHQRLPGKDRKLLQRNAMELFSAEIPSHEKPRKIHSFEDVLTGHSARCKIREENAHTFFEVRIGLS